MSSDLPSSAGFVDASAGTTAVSPPSRYKIRLRFRKDGNLRLVSHHDLMHCFERMFRRAGLPVARTKGFHPTPRMVFALSLALGVVGCEEVVELELTEYLPAQEVLERLARHCPPGLQLLRAQPTDPRQTARVRRVGYEIVLPPHHLAGLPERLAAFLAAPECWIERTRPSFRRFNLRPLVRELRLDRDVLTIDLWVTPQGMARPEEVLEVLGLPGWQDEGLVLYRTCVELLDEVPGAPVPGVVEAPQEKPLPLARETPAQAAAAAPGEGGSLPHVRPPSLEDGLPSF